MLARSAAPPKRFRAGLWLLLSLTLALAAADSPLAQAAAPKPAWTITVVPGPTNFTPGDVTGRDAFLVTATNRGGAPTTGGTITLTDRLPEGLTLFTGETPSSKEFGAQDNAGNWELQSPNKGNLACNSGPSVVTCTDSQKGTISGQEHPIQPGESITMFVPVMAAANVAGLPPNTVTISGGGAPAASASVPTEISSAPASFDFLAGPQGFDGLVSAADGSAVTQAGSRPYQATLTFNLNSNIYKEDTVGAAEEARTVTANLPPGVIVNPNATPTKCTEAQLETDFQEGGGCPDSSAVGTVQVVSGAFGPAQEQTTPLYNMVAPSGWPADLGFDAVAGLYIHLRGEVRTGGDYGLSAVSNDILQEGFVSGFSATLWGNPSDPSHDAVRGHCFLTGINTGATCPVEPTNTALLTLPTKCSGPVTTTIEAESWQEPGKLVNDAFLSHDTSGSEAGVTGCSLLDFSPSITVRPDTTVADSPSGLEVDLRIPQNEDVNGLAEANLKDAVVTLPPGMTVNPSSANGLQACSSAQIDLHGSGPARCPDASKLGSVEVVTPLLDHPLPGAVYLAKQGDNPFNSLLAIYIAVDDPATGVVVKLAGHVEPDAGTGQLKTTFAENPQLPFSEFKLRFFGGSNAPLVTPAECGTHSTATALTGWNEALATPGDTFPVTSGCNGGFAPSFSAGTTNNQAGGFSPLSVTVSRKDGEQRLGEITVQMPPGLLGKIAGIPQCPEQLANAGTCPTASQIGTATAGAGAGPNPFYVPEAGQPPNPVYLTGAYKGAPFGLSIVTHALAGPFDLGSVVVRARIGIDPHTAQITVTSDPLPTILQGIPLDLRTVNVTVDRPAFALNPTNCTALSVRGEITSTGGSSAGVSSPFQAANCAALPFRPSLSAATQAKTSKANGASLEVKVSQRPGEANIHKVDVSLPLALPSRLTTLQKACTEVQFAANPAGCPAGSTVGTAMAHTPLLNVPLTGPAYLVSHGGAAFPDLDLVLQGEGIVIDLVGNTDIKKGITFSRFESVPDAPISSFDLNLPEGPHSALAAYGDLCAPTKSVTVRKRVTVRRHGHTLHLVRSVSQPVAERLLLPTTIVGQNGAQLTQTTPVTVTGCPRPSLTLKKPKVTAGAVLVTVTTSQAGTLTISGGGLKTTKTVLGAGTHRVKAPLTKTGLTGLKHHMQTHIKARFEGNAGAVSKTTAVKL